MDNNPAAMDQTLADKKNILGPIDEKNEKFEREDSGLDRADTGLNDRDETFGSLATEQMQPLPKKKPGFKKPAVNITAM